MLLSFTGSNEADGDTLGEGFITIEIAKRIDDGGEGCWELGGGREQRDELRCRGRDWGRDWNWDWGRDWGRDWNWNWDRDWGRDRCSDWSEGKRVIYGG